MKSLFFSLFLLGCTSLWAQDFVLTPQGYFNKEGIDVMAFDDFYPEGHQGGVCLIMNGQRVATNGDIRLEATPGQWQPVSKLLKRTLSSDCITTTLCYPDTTRHMTGFNPMIYPDFQFRYTVTVQSKGNSIEITVDLDRPLDEEYIGKAGFNLEFFPGTLFGKPWIMDDQSGIYPQQPNAPLQINTSYKVLPWPYRNPDRPLADREGLIGKGYSPIVADDIIALPYATGATFTSRPDDPYTKVTVQSLTGELQLYDGRMNHNNGWFVLHESIAAGAIKGAIKWIITPNVVAGWQYKPVIQTSQVGYLPHQEKVAILETDPRQTSTDQAQIVRITAQGEEMVQSITPEPWGRFLRYNYLKVPFSDVTEPGLYRIDYQGSSSPLFSIAENVYDRGVWQPVLEYFLPVQMCHMRVNEKYRVWHDLCHMDDAVMAPAHNHIDGYNQKEGLSHYAAGEAVPGVNVGGWHDAGDFDLRVESQAGECYILALTQEAFHPYLDVTAIDQHNHVTEIHQPDGKNDLLQQVEHGALSVVNGYLALGRLYRGIICGNLRQYVLLGDAAAMTDGFKGNADDRWIFTEDNPGRALTTAAHLAASARVLKGFNDTLSTHCLGIAKELFERTPGEGRSQGAKIHAATELFLTTKLPAYRNFILEHLSYIVEHIDETGWYLARVECQWDQKKNPKMKAFTTAFMDALTSYKERLAAQVAETPYGVPYHPNIWGAGWDIQGFGFRHYFLVDAYPDLFDEAPVCNALNFVLGCHPGSNQASFASGVGAQSATVGYGLNRADWSYIPGGVISGTALIRPDFPELLTFPYLWQQTEYVLGGGSSHYMFLVLAATKLINEKH